MSETMQHVIAIAYGVPFIWIGIQHFRDPEWFEPIVPSVLGNPKFWVYLSGVFEILLGLGVVLPWYRNESALGISLMLVVLYWANLNMWLNDIPLNGKTYATHWHVVRGFVQVALICLALWIGGWWPFSESENLTPS